MSGGGATVPLDDLDYVESPAPPLPDEKETPEESAQTVKSPQTEEIRADLSAAMRLTRTRSLRKRIFVLMGRSSRENSWRGWRRVARS